MKIETKFDIGQEVYTIKGEKIYKRTIDAVSIGVTMNPFYVTETNIYYTIKEGEREMEEGTLFATPDECRQSIEVSE